MKKQLIFTMAVAALGLTACSSGQKVEIAKASQDKTIVPQKVAQPTLPNNIPPNATAMCRDGSFSTASFEDRETACIGNGGVLHFINRYHSE
ncbi:DUF3761 domain-containing protein [Muribacter muris]|uniref:DUF3761 domain-containing protein n=1 Tax=Muribacter muris TaxID=67855 RepID=A0A4Y9K4J6_9PAST|nr:DUF3761 domain-containing protein [Muribacter muris]MBF0784547.1 DUF3761 domain-containing protein [Muribacter muris]MBF0826157.1 DUF3761 domain-containing protein [Muribacter muris]TFV12059.1 DUF3761 domain-containing protein [Muribacter muris]